MPWDFYFNKVCIIVPLIFSSNRLDFSSLLVTPVLGVLRFRKLFFRACCLCRIIISLTLIRNLCHIGGLNLLFGSLSPPTMLFSMLCGYGSAVLIVCLYYASFFLPVFLFFVAIILFWSGTAKKWLSTEISLASLMRRIF